MKMGKHQLNAFAFAIVVAINSASAAETELLSTAGGSVLPGTSSQPSLSYDGQSFAFISNSGSLVGDKSNLQHIYFKNILSSKIQRASVHSNGTIANSISFNPKLSGDGRYIVFYSLANNLVDGDTNSTTDVFVYDTVDRTTHLVSSDSHGNISDGESTEAVISFDGRYIAFSSLARNLISTDTKGKRNVYVKDMLTGQIELISGATLSSPGDGDSFLPAISGNGRFVAFSSIANNLDSHPANNQYDIYLHDRERKTIQRIPFSYDGSLSNGHSGQVSISDDGDVIAYISLSNNIVKNDKNGQIDIFIYDNSSKETKRILSSLGENNGPSFYPQVSGNGRFVAFYSSASNLVSGDSNGKDDLFVYDRYLNKISLASISTDGKQVDNNIDSIFTINYDGTNTAFATSSSLTAKDTNKQMDVYKRHIDPPPNLKPVARATPIPAQVCIDGGATVTLDGRSSTDADKDTLSYDWSGDFGHVSGEVVDIYLGPGKHNITLTVTDTHGDSNTTSLTVDVTDNINPVLSIDAPVTLEATSASGVVHTIKYSASDNCKLASVNIAPTLAAYPLGTSNVRISAFDTLGNSASASTNVTVIDSTPPKLTLPSDKTIEATSSAMSVNIGNASASDYFLASIANNAPALFPLGTSKITWTATDTSGNQSSGIQKIHVLDTTPPELTTDSRIVLEATSRQGASYNIQYQTSDSCKNCGPININLSPLLSYYPLGETNVSVTAIDASNNSTTKNTIIKVQDTTPPNLTLPADRVAEAEDILTALLLDKATATDIFPVSITNNAPAAFPLGENTVTWTATDSNGNQASGTQKVTLIDTKAPVLTVPDDITIEASALLSAVELGQATADDIFDVSIANNAPTAFPLGTSKVTWTATDTSGNTVEKVQLVKVVDTTAPTLTIPDNLQLEANGILSTVDLGNATANDIFHVTVTNDAPLQFPIGDTEVTWTATDSNGNKTSAIQIITVSDTTAPVLTMPKDITVEANDILSTVSIGQATAKDIFTTTVASNAPDTYPLGDTVVTWTATDANGNKAEAKQTITVVDTTAPVLQIPSNLVIEATGKLTPVTIGQASAKDIFSIEISNDAPGAYPLGYTLVNWTAIDANGNRTTAVQKITIIDTTPPAVNAGKDITLEAISRAGVGFSPSYQASDICDCGDLKITVTPKLENYPLGNTQITVTATDISGNSASDTMTLTVVDTTKPLLTAPANITLEATGKLTPVLIGNAITSDIFEVNLGNNAPPLFPLGTNIVTWTATDSNNNVSTANQLVTIIDTTAPEFQLNIDKNKLWPANHKMVHVGNVTQISDLVDDTPVVKIEITSNADHKRHHEKADWKIVEENGEWQIWLRAEKAQQHKEDRIYTIDVSVSDFTGNTKSQTSEVIVPHHHHRESQNESGDNKKHQSDKQNNEKHEDSKREEHKKHNE